MAKKYITTDGKTCREINPHQPFDTGGLNAAFDEFEQTVKNYPLTKEMPIGEFEGKEVKQVYYSHLYFPARWFNVDENEYVQAIHYVPENCRIAISPIAKPLEGSSTPAIDAGERVEETAEAFVYSDDNQLGEYEQDRDGYDIRVYNAEDCVKSFIAGHTHALKGYVRVEEVVEVINKNSNSQHSKPYIAMMSDDLINQIKQLSK